MHRISKPKHRRGWTLIEMSVYIGIAAVLLPVVFVALAQAMRASDHVREQSQSASSLERLARQFRDDVHEAAAATVAQGGKELLLTMAGERRIRYKSTAAAVERTVKAGDVTQQRDTFPLSGLAPGDFEVRSDPAEAVLLLRVVPDPQPRPAAGGRTLELAAGVARNHRFEKQE
jgi:type II secretory pathway pseudopilin PulG